MSHPNLMKKKSSNSLKLVLTTECGECTVLKDTVEGLQKTASKLEEFLNNYKNDTDNKIGELHKEVVNIRRDNIEILAHIKNETINKL